jgi:hypothetical protein
MRFEPELSDLLPIVLLTWTLILRSSSLCDLVPEMVNLLRASFSGNVRECTNQENCAAAVSSAIENIARVLGFSRPAGGAQQRLHIL